MSNDKKILVTGATGQQGGAVSRELLKNGYKVKAMTRNPDNPKAKELAELGAEIVRGDFDDAASLEIELAGVWGAFAVQNSWEGGVEKEEEQGKRFAEISKKVNLQHLVYTSVGSAHRDTGIPHFDNKWRIEEKIRSLDLPSYTIIRPVFFMDNFLSPWFKPSIDQGQLAVGMNPNSSLQMIAVEDIGKHGLRAFKNYKELNGKAIDIAGDELTMTDAAKIISDKKGSAVEFSQVPIEEVRNFSDDYALMLEWFDDVGYNVKISSLAEESVISPIKFSAWANNVGW